MKAVALVFALILASCASTEPIIRTEKVEIAVPVRCKVSFPEKPRKHLNEVIPEDSVLVKGNAALAEIKEREGYEQKLEAALKACADPQ